MDPALAGGKVRSGSPFQHRKAVFGAGTPAVPSGAHMLGSRFPGRFTAQLDGRLLSMCKWCKRSMI